jgi:nicotinate-nucleotide pyrophosphorylase (carboxylating)
MLTWNPRVRRLVRMALEEDIGTWDLTSAILPPDLRATGAFVAREEGVLAGVDLIDAVYHEMGVTVELLHRLDDGADLAPGTEIAVAHGNARALLVAERTILNFVQHLSGVASATRGLVRRIAGTQAHVVDTRKTLPGWRALEKYAVSVGGGRNHRHCLSGGVLIKNNHIDALGGITRAVATARQTSPTTVRVEVEVRDVAELREALDSGADMILLDNMSPQQVQAAVELVGGRVPLEASGGVREDTIRAFAEAGVQYISVGALTHSVRALDIAFAIRSHP